MGLIAGALLGPVICHSIPTGPSCSACAPAYAGRCSLADARRSLPSQVLSATAYLHAHNIVHRDLKPENIIFKTRTELSPIVVADFGIAKHLETPDEEVADVAGSLGYAAPEVLLGKGHGLKVDCWSIG